MNDRLRSAWKQAWTKTERGQWEFGLLGRHNEDSSITFVVPGRALYLFVTMRHASGAQTVVPARNEGGVPHSADLPVKLKNEQGTYVIYGKATREDLATVPATPPSGVPIHLHNLADLNDVTITAAAAGDVLVHNGTDWVDAATIPVAMAATIHAATLDTTPLDADEVPGLESTGGAWTLLRWTWTSIKAFLKTYFDTLYNLYTTENAQDDVGGILVDSATIDFTYTDATPEITAIVKDASITYAKIQNVSATDKLLGRSTAGAGVIEEIALTAFARSLIDDIDAAAGRATLGLGTMALATETAYLLLAGRAGGQVAYGGTAANEDLTLEGTSHATKTTSYVILQPTAGNVGIGIPIPEAPLHVQTATTTTFKLRSGGAVGVGRAFIQLLRGASGAEDGWDLSTNVSQADDEFSIRQLAASAATVRLTMLKGGNLGLGISPLAAIHVLQATLGSVVQRLQSTATNDDTIEDVVQARVATTDATVTTLHTFTIPASTTYAIDMHVVARRTGGASGTAEDGAYYVINAVFKNVAGVATAIGANSLQVSEESQAGWACVIDVTGATARARVTGAVGNNITWHLTARVYAVSS